MMRRALTLLAVLALAAFGLAGTASAAPTVTVTATPGPIPGVPHTGYHFGWGASLKTEVTIKGTEYGGYPPPLIGVNVYLPKGTVLHPQGFPTCSVKVLVEEKEPTKCPRGSKAGPIGKAEGFVVFGTERVPETVTIESFFVPGGGIDFFVAGHTPTLIEIVSSGRFVGNRGGFGPTFLGTVPLVETVPGAPDASVEHIDVALGSAYKHGRTWVPYGRVPTKCPRGGSFVGKAELIFAGLGGLQQQTVPVTVKKRCPRF